ncbi:MAG: T9SS type A sorting domain-containing protein [Cyclobacteriaceae bacterium]
MKTNSILLVVLLALNTGYTQDIRHKFVDLTTIDVQTAPVAAFISFVSECDTLVYEANDIRRKARMARGHVNKYIRNNYLCHEVKPAHIIIQPENSNIVNVTVKQKGNSLFYQYKYSCEDFMNADFEELRKDLLNSIVKTNHLESYSSGVSAVAVAVEGEIPGLVWETDRTSGFEILEANMNPAIVKIKHGFKGKVGITASSMLTGTKNVIANKSLWIGTPVLAIGNYFNSEGPNYLCPGKIETISGYSSFSSFDSVQWEFDKSKVKFFSAKVTSMELLLVEGVNYIEIRYRAHNDFGWNDWEKTSFSVLDECNVVNDGHFIFNVYPNPTADHIYIKPEDNRIGAKYMAKFFNSLGDMVYEPNIGEGGHVDISSLKPGKYFLRIVSKIGTFEHQVIVE